jgi:hypothetical protein
MQEGGTLVYVQQQLAALKQKEMLARAEHARLVTEACWGRPGILERGYATLRQKIRTPRPVATSANSPVRS